MNPCKVDKYTNSHVYQVLIDACRERQGPCQDTERDFPYSNPLEIEKTREGNRVLALLSTVNTVREQVQGLLCFCSLKRKWHPNAHMLQYMIHN